jgi:hypothetical protein
MRFAEPAHALVMSDQGDCAIVLARRGEIYRVSRLDLVGKRLQHWCDARFTRFATNFDGSIWFVARGGTLYAIDTLAPRWAHLWKVDEQDATVHAVARDARWLSALFSWRGRCEVWTYELPSITLRRRTPAIRGADSIDLFSTVSPCGLLLAWRKGPEKEPDSGQWAEDYDGILMDIDGAWKNLPVSVRLPPPSAVTNDWIALAVGFEPMHPRSVIHLVETGNPVTRLRVTLDGVSLVSGRIQADRLIVVDSGGRVTAVSLSSGAVLREICLT